MLFVTISKLVILSKQNMWLYNQFKFNSLPSEIEKKADISKRKSDNINRKMEYIIKIHQERGFDLLLQYADCDTEQRSGNLTFPKVIIDTGNTICINKIINCWLSMNIKMARHSLKNCWVLQGVLVNLGRESMKHAIIISLI